MSYKDYLQNRTNYYVVEDFNGRAISRYNHAEQYNALLKRMQSIANNIENTLDFLETSDPEVYSVIMSTLDKLEAKVQSIKRAARAISRSNKDAGRIADISVVDLTHGTFDGMSYSVTHNGLILGHVSSIKLL